jgi:hypothetical protein
LPSKPENVGLLAEEEKKHKKRWLLLQDVSEKYFISVIYFLGQSDLELVLLTLQREKI